MLLAFSLSAYLTPASANATVSATLCATGPLQITAFPNADMNLYAIPAKDDKVAVTMLSNTLPNGLERGVVDG